MTTNIPPEDGLGGTDGAGNVHPLFTNRATAAGLPPQPDVIDALEQLLARAREGKVVGLAVLALDNTDGFTNGYWGQSRYLTVLGGLADLQYEVAARYRANFPRPGQ